MMILINTDSNISGTDEMREPLKATVANALDRYSDDLTRVELKISDENADKRGANDKRCVLEVRPKGLQPVVVTSNGDSIEMAVEEAINKMKASLDTVLGRLRDR